MEHISTSYQALGSGEEHESPHERLVLIHQVPENDKVRWNHIEDLDDFFIKVYRYHQKYGFLCMMLQEILELIQFVFVVLFSLFLFGCIRYEKLSGTESADLSLTIWDIFIPANECMNNLHPAVYVFLLIPASVFWLLQLLRVGYHFFQYLEIRTFYQNALRISTADLQNMTWHDVQRRLQEVQKEQQLCIHKQELSELDIYHRILRFKNYMVAMVNKSLLPIHYRLPFFGNMVFLTQGLKYNLEMILFWGPWSPWENNWHLKDNYKDVRKRKELAKHLSDRILWIGIANFFLCPLVLIWQVLYMFFNYAAIVRREPGSLGARRWSQHGRLYLRHFNELDHELQARLNRGYRPASKYMSIFVSRIMTIIAKSIAFFAGAILIVLIIITIAFDHHIHVSNELAAITVLSIVITACSAFIPDENLVFCPETLMTMVLAHVHYMPDSWKDHAHTLRVRDEFSQLFQFKAVFLLEELLSPIITPCILCFSLRHKALEIVDFFHNFTVDVIGVGDVCSFAQMDVRRHGNRQWAAEGQTEATHYQQAEDGKTELSLIHFTLTNPQWKPPAECTAFVTSIRERVQRDASLFNSPTAEETALYQSLYSLSSLGPGHNSLISSIMQPPSGSFARQQGGIGELPRHPNVKTPHARGGVSRTEGPLGGSSTGILGALAETSGSGLCVSTQLPDQNLTSMQPSALQTPELGAYAERTVTDMSLSTLYLHELHHRRKHLHGYEDMQHRTVPALSTQDVYIAPRQAVAADLDELAEKDGQENGDDDDDTAPMLHHT